MTSLLWWFLALTKTFNRRKALVKNRERNHQMNIKLCLYGTSACHLCEQAEALLHALAENKALCWDTVDIADDERLMQRYGLKIPVLYELEAEAELCWPFTKADILHWLVPFGDTK